MVQIIFIGTAAGIASALLFVATVVGTPAGPFLYLAAPLPLMIATLGYGPPAGGIAAAAALLSVSALGGGIMAGLYLLAFATPSLFLCRQAMLAEVGSGGPGAPVVWYPAGRLLAWATLWAGALAGLSVLAQGASVAAYERAIAVLIEDGLKPSLEAMGLPASPEDLATYGKIMLTLLPAAAGITWLLILVLNLWGAGRIARASGRLQRAWPDLAGIEPPFFLSVTLLASILASTAGGLTGLIGRGFAAAHLLAFLLAGLAVLHDLTRGSRLRVPLLIAVYGLLVLVGGVPAIAIALLGLAEPLLGLRARRRAQRAVHSASFDSTNQPKE